MTERQQEIKTAILDFFNQQSGLTRSYSPDSDDAIAEALSTAICFLEDGQQDIGNSTVLKLDQLFDVRWVQKGSTPAESAAKAYNELSTSVNWYLISNSVLNINHTHRHLPTHEAAVESADRLSPEAKPGEEKLKLSRPIAKMVAKKKDGVEVGE